MSTETFEQTINRLNGMSEDKRAEPGYAAKLEAALKLETEKENARRTSELRHGWNAPLRQVCTSGLFKDGPWGATFSKIQSNLSTGIMVALVGGRGSGKTQMAVEFMRTATAQRRSAFYLTATRFFALIKESYRPDSARSQVQVIDWLRSFRLLVIDEIGKRGETDWENNLLFELVNSSYQDMNDIILIDNNEPDQFAAAVGPSIASRIAETGGIVHCNWKGFR